MKTSKDKVLNDPGPYCTTLLSPIRYFSSFRLAIVPWIPEPTNDRASCLSDVTNCSDEWERGKITKTGYKVRPQRSFYRL